MARPIGLRTRSFSMIIKKLLLRTSLVALPVLALVACKATRAGYESADYSTQKKESKFEIRNYPALSVVSTSASGSAGSREDDGQFMRLFRYISGDNSGEQKIAMTTPVFMDQRDAGSRMSFVLPTDVAAKSPPVPKNERVSLQQLPARKMAVLRYSGAGGRKTEEEHIAKLRSWMLEQKLTAAGDPVVAYYDPPFTPTMLRRNEVMIPIK